MVMLWNITTLFAVVIGAAMGVIWLALRRVWLPLIPLLLVIAYFVVISAGAEADSRMRIPFFPYLAILFGVGAVITGSLIAKREFGPLWRRSAELTVP